MRFLVVVAVIVLVALLGAAARQMSREFPRGLKDLVDSGALFLFLGILLGPGGLRFVTPHYLDQLGPVVAIALGWIGFFFGLNLQWRWLSRFTASLYVLALVQSCTTFALVAAAFALVLPYFERAGCGPFSVQSASVVLAAAAAGTAPSSLFLLGERTGAGALLRGIRFVAAVDDLPGLLALGLLFSFAHAYSSTPGPVLLGWQWFLLSVLLGAGLGSLLAALVPAYRDEQKGGVVILGVIALGAGVCAFVYLSPLFVGVIAGVIFGNFSAHAERVFAQVAAREHAIYVFFLLLAGCMWRYEPVALLLAAAYILLRAAGKLAGAAVGTLALSPYRADPRLGLMLLPQGGMAIAMAVDYHRTYATSALPPILSIVIIAVAVNELLGPTLALSELRIRERR